MSQPLTTSGLRNIPNLAFPMIPTSFADQPSPIAASGAVTPTINAPKISQFPVHLRVPSIPLQPQFTDSNVDPTTTTNAFFTFFYASHPFLLPRTRLVECLRSNRLPHLQLAIQYIGSMYIPSAPTELFKQAVDEFLFRRDLHKNGFMVQAMLLFVIGLHASGEIERAAEVMQSAISTALDIGMHYREYASENGAGCSVIQESWRRTWWKLYVVNGLIAGTNQNIPFQLFEVEAPVAYLARRATLSLVLVLNHSTTFFYSLKTPYIAHSPPSDNSGVRRFFVLRWGDRKLLRSPHCRCSDFRKDLRCYTVGPL